MEIPKIEQKKKQKEKQQEVSQILNELTEGYDSDIEQQLSAERIQAVEMEIQQDEHPMMETDDEDPPDVKYQKKKLKRELRAEAMRRQEEAARTVADFDDVVECWDNLDENWNRRVQYHEVTRGDVPLEYGCSPEASVVPAWLSKPSQQAIRHGRFLDAIFTRPEELHEMTGHDIIPALLKDLKMEYKDLLFRLVVQGQSTTQLAETIGQSDRNIRKKKMRLLNRLREDLYEELHGKKDPSRREMAFLAEYEKTALGEAESGEKEWCVV